MIGKDAPKLRRKIEKLIEEVRREMKVQYKLKKNIPEMNWTEKMETLSPECWMVEQTLNMLEKHLKREDRTVSRYK